MKTIIDILKLVIDNVDRIIIFVYFFGLCLYMTKTSTRETWKQAIKENSGVSWTRYVSNYLLLTTAVYWLAKTVARMPVSSELVLGVIASCLVGKSVGKFAENKKSN